MPHGRRVWMPLLCLSVLLAMAGPARAHSGHTNWGPWRFDWEVKDGAGLALRNVTFNNELVIWKASMPVIRVRYDRDCGPYADRIDWGNLLEISNCDNAKVCQKSFASGGRNWLRIDVLAAIGSYRLNQIWFLSDDGYIQARLSSRGLQCDVDHDHHPYWRLDLDINGASSDQVFVFDNNRPNQGWGAGWLKYTSELNEVKNAGTGRVWFVRDSPTSHGMWILPGTDDGSADGFSSKDAAPRLYVGSEDEPWPFSTDHLGYLNGQNIAEKDVVFWYVAHLHHHAAEGGDQWHRAGPWLKVAR